jgi:predicted porin
MQKKLLTVAVAGALAAPCIALAQGSGAPGSSVEVYGTINMAAGNFKYSGTTTLGGVTVPSVSKWDVSQGASNYGLRGRESLGGGLTAWFQIEQNAPMERSNNVAITPASRNSAVGLQGGFGNIFLGMWTTPWADLDGLWAVGTVGYWGPVTSIIGRRETTGAAPNPNCINNQSSGGFIAPGVPAAGIVCDAIEAGGGVGHPFWRRASQSIVYQSPVFSGFQVKFLYQTNDQKSVALTPTAPVPGPSTTTVANPQMWSGSVQWAGMGGRARIGAAYDNHKEFTTAGKSDTGWRVTGGYNFGIADVGLAYEEMKYGVAAGDCKHKQYGVALAVPVGQGAIRASYSVAKDVDGPGALAAGQPGVGAPGGPAWGTSTCASTTPLPAAAGAAAGLVPADNGAKQYNIGYDHRFSKRTTVGVGYAAIKNDPGSVLSWTGAPPVQDGANNTPFAGSDPSTFFVNITHRF